MEKLLYNDPTAVKSSPVANYREIRSESQQLHVRVNGRHTQRCSSDDRDTFVGRPAYAHAGIVYR